MSSKQQTKYILFFSFILYFPIITYNSNISKSWFDCEYVSMWPSMGLTSTLNTLHNGSFIDILDCLHEFWNWHILKYYWSERSVCLYFYQVAFCYALSCLKP